ncbi:serine hydrolase domain-containing protein [Dongia sp.]|uniref:serine hydrolase domain-containing protein n=1 Tax=Dongia sp. TaxID=1977262 RepID=UPI0035AEA44A
MAPKSARNPEEAPRIRLSASYAVACVLNILAAGFLVACAAPTGEVAQKKTIFTAIPGGADLPTQIPNAVIAGDYDCGRWHACPLREFMWRSRLCALVVVKDGTIVYERYAPDQSTRCKREAGDGPNGRDRHYGLASITKSITSTLLGLLIARNEADPAHPWGEIDLAKPVGHYVPGLTDAAGQPTLEQVLRMRSGFAWDDRDNLLYERTVLDSEHRGVPFAAAAGELAKRIPGPSAFNYSGLDTTLAGLVVEAILQRNHETRGWHLDDALTHWIWQPLAMKGNAEWKTDSDRTPAPFCCLSMRARDLAKFGQFILDNVVAPADSDSAPLHGWMAKALQMQGGVTDLAATHCRNFNLDYGYQWWPFLNPASGFLGLGIRGQMLHVFPREHIVIVQFSTMSHDEELDLECASYAAHRAIVAALSN